MQHAFLKNTFDQSPSSITFDAFIAGVRDGAYRPNVEKITSFMAGKTVSEQTVDGYKELLAKLKQQLPGIVPSLQYTPGDRTGGELSGILCIDYDDVSPVQFHRELQWLPGLKYLLASYTSVSGTGVAAFYKYTVVKWNVNGDIEKFVDVVHEAAPKNALRDAKNMLITYFRYAPKSNFGAVMEAMASKGLIPPNFDKQVKDFSRLRFVSHDPDLFYNPMAKTLNISVDAEYNVPPGKRKLDITYTADVC
jgi:hypothetical protein